mmetsp:Transcript_65559/g.77052  ORF Transcript_65559/g.77052 Transcript_65559/m.77052 type:complete len:211 (-) Transcript_65559:300-932(-)
MNKNKKQGRTSTTATATANLPTHAFVVRWARETTVEDFSNEGLNDIETCGHDPEEAKSYIRDWLNEEGKATDDGGDGGVRDANGLHGEVFTCESAARIALRERLIALASEAREGVMQKMDVDETQYAAERAANTVVEHTTPGGWNDNGMITDTGAAGNVNASSWHEMIVGEEEAFVVYWGPYSHKVGALIGGIENVSTCVSCWVERLILS